MIGLGSIFLNFSNDPNFRLNDKQPNTSTLSGPIYIDGNEGWVNLKDSGGCTGSGNLLDPYIIRNLEINGGGSENCIEISSSNVYFKIENCELFNGQNGLMVHESKNGQIINNDCHNNVLAGIFFDPDCNGFLIRGNSLTYNDYGISLWTSNYNIIKENECSNNNFGILLDPDCNNNEILYNLICNNGWGISLNAGSDNNKIEGNSLRENGVAIRLDSSNCNFIFMNIFVDNINNQEGTQEICPTHIILPIMFIIVLSGSLILIIRKKKTESQEEQYEKREESYMDADSDIKIIEMEALLEKQETSVEYKTEEHEAMKIEESEILEEKKIPSNELAEEEFDSTKELYITENAVTKEEKIESKEMLEEKEEIELIPDEIIVEQQEIFEEDKKVPISQESIPEKSQIEEKIQKLTEIPSSLREKEEDILKPALLSEKEVLTEENILEEESALEGLDKDDKYLITKERLVKEEDEVIDLESENGKPTKKIIEVVDGIKCEYCGFSNEMDASFCKQCGQVIKKRN